MYLAAVVKDGNVHAYAGGGGGRQGAADDPADHTALCLHCGLAALQGDVGFFVDLRGGGVLREEHGDRAGRRALRTQAHGGNGARNGFNIIVYGCQIVQSVHGIKNHLGAEIHLKAVVVAVDKFPGFPVADIQMNEALVGVIIRAALRNIEKITEVEGEPVVVGSHRLFFRSDFQTPGIDNRFLADLCQVFILIIDKGKGGANAQDALTNVKAAGSDRDFGLLQSLDHHVAAENPGAFQNLGTGLAVGLHHGHGAGDAYALALAAQGPCQGLGCQKARESAVQVLPENGVGRHALSSGKLAGQLHVCLIVVDAYRHTQGDHTVVDKGEGGRIHGLAGSVGTVVRAVFGLGIHAPGGVFAADGSLGLVSSDIDTHSRGDIDAVLTELLNRLGRGAGSAQGVVGGGIVHGGSGGQVQAQHAHHHGHQGAAPNAVGHSTIPGCGNLIELPHHHAVDHTGRRVVGGIRNAESRSDLLKIPVQIGAVGQSEGIGLVLVQGFRVNKDTAFYVSLPVKVGTYIGSGEIDGNGASHRGSAAGGKAGGGGIGLPTLAGTQIEICLLGNGFPLLVCGDPRCGDNISAAQGQNRALIDRGSDGVLYDIQRHGGIHRDILGGGAV